MSETRSLPSGNTQHTVSRKTHMQKGPNRAHIGLFPHWAQNLGAGDPEESAPAVLGFTQRELITPTASPFSLLSQNGKCLSVKGYQVI